MLCSKSKNSQATKTTDDVTQSSNPSGLFAKRGRSTSLPVTTSPLGITTNDEVRHRTPTLHRQSINIIDRSEYELRDTGREMIISPSELSPTVFLRNKQIVRGEMRSQIQQDFVKNEAASPAEFTL